MVSPPIEETKVTANQAYDPIKNPGAPPTINVGTGFYLITVQDSATPPHQRVMRVKADPNSPLLRGPNATAPHLAVRQTGVNDQPGPNGVPPTPIYSGPTDAQGLNWIPVGGLEDLPASASKTVSPIDQWEKRDAKGDPIPPGSTTPPAY